MSAYGRQVGRLYSGDFTTDAQCNAARFRQLSDIFTHVQRPQ